MSKETAITVSYSVTGPGDKNPCPDNAYDNLDEGKEGNTSPREDEPTENQYDNLPGKKEKSGTVSPLDKDYAFDK